MGRPSSEEFEVKRILGHRVNVKDRTEFEVSWVHYEETTWVSEWALKNSKALLNEYKEKVGLPKRKRTNTRSSVLRGSSIEQRVMRRTRNARQTVVDKSRGDMTKISMKNKKSKEVYEVEKIIYHMSIPRKPIFYCVKWKGYMEASFISENFLSNCSELLEDYWTRILLINEALDSFVKNMPTNVDDVPKSLQDENTKCKLELEDEASEANRLQRYAPPRQERQEMGIDLSDSRMPISDQFHQIRKAHF